MTGDLSLFGPLLESAPYRDLESRVRDGEAPVALSGLVGGARSLVLSLLLSRIRRRILLVVEDDGSLGSYHRDLAALAAMVGRDPGRVVVLPALDASPYDSIPPHPEIVRERVIALGRIVRGEVDLILTPARSLLGWFPSPGEWKDRFRTVRAGDDLPPDRFMLEAIGYGYRRVDTVSAPGEVSRRGGIVDIFPPESEEPVRIELFGDTVDSLRSFDTDHQRSTGMLREVVVGPASENPPTEDVVERLERYLDRGARRTGGDLSASRRIREILETLQNEGWLPGLEALAGLTSRSPVLLTEYVRDYLVVVDEPERVDEELIRADHESRRAWEESEERILPPPDRLYAGPERVAERLRQAGVTLQELSGEEPEVSSAVIRIPARPARAYDGKVQETARDLASVSTSGGRAVCVMRASGGAERLAEILRDYGLETSLGTGGGPEPGTPVRGGGIFLRVGGLRNGFELPDQALLVLTEREIFGERKKVKERKPSGRAAFVSDFRDLKQGGMIVHVDHGIARYGGLGRPKGGSLNRDFMVLEFAAGDRLFVPVDRLDLVQKYSGVAGKKAVLDRLGGPGWERVKSKVRKSVRLMARELLELYARRKAARGHRFAADSPWQKELEDAFPYEFTPDQRRTLQEVKSDMESGKPMDRLLVGDVGFGKTEVAVRAAFKAVLDGYQVAVLAPTTVLAFQHFKTFRQRFAPFPVRVEMISRFRTPAENRKVIAAAGTGEVDILIGTHRLLSRDVSFRRLGFLVVDEEQRFGVAHKERLKKMSVGMDVLSMTATPIPRTLQMSLAGVRDLSIIETPPPGRMAIQTYLIPWRNNVLAQAIRQELRREGQVFVVHDRVETLPALAEAIRKLIPEARIVVAHGQMREGRLEAVMMKFVEYEADVLVTTTIIENGLDIPRANTIVVNRADRFGLAQLYQLRGRVGRSEKHAYAYFVIPGRSNLSDTARQRLRALQEFSDLGAGFRLAAADLEIRGAGELLGAKQHGHIAALGFDLYCQMMEREVREMQGEPVEDRPPVNLHLGVDIKVPESYMAEAGNRLALYKRLAGAAEGEDVRRIRSETEDRYGQMPQACGNLFDLAELRIAAGGAGVTRVDVTEGRLQIRFDPQAPVEPSRMVEVVRNRKGSLTPTGMLILPAPARASARIRAVMEILEEMGCSA
jgi:transcription-repair coupling factor (superfamily II helicase)